MAVYYNIAGYILEVLKGELGHIPGFSCFSSCPILSDTIISLRLEEYVSDDKEMKLIYQFDIENSTCEFLSNDNSYLFRVSKEGIQWLMEIYPEKGKFIARTNMDKDTDIPILRFAIWTAFGIAALHRQIVAIHASAITYNGRSVLFLGESGTGKSTQSRLWLQHIQGVELLNDDSPLICIDKEKPPVVWGSPWSGKTPCYKNKQAPVAAFIRLKQASNNAIKRLRIIEAIGALQPSLPPIFATDPVLSGMMHECLSSILQHIPVYYLECLPDEDAANLVYATLKEDGWIQ